MRRIVFISVAVLLVGLLLSGCGVPQADLDAASAEAAAAKAQVASLQSDYNKAKSDLTAAKAQAASLQSDLDAAEGDLADAESQASSLQSKYSTASSQLSSVKSELTAAQARIAELEAAVPEEPAEEEAAAEEEEEAVAEEEEEAAAAEEEEEAGEEVALTQEIINDEYGFSITVPADWSEVAGTHMFDYGAPAGVPSVYIDIIDGGGTLEDTLTNKLETAGANLVDIKSVEPITLNDGTTAEKAVLYWEIVGYEIDSVVISLEKGGKRYLFQINTISFMLAFDEPFFTRIGKTVKVN